MTTTDTPHLDADEIHAKYRAERDKRLREDGNEQYVEPVGKFAHYLADPYAEDEERDPLRDHVTVAFIGGGFSGLLTGAMLKKAGIDDVRIVEKGGDFGGTWYWNRYPGARCDTAAMVYLPLLEETGHMPTEKYTRAPEILEHSQRIGRHFGLYENALFSTEVKALDWDSGNHVWVVRTNRGDEFTAKYVAMGTGPLHRPKLPGIPGIERYAGHSFHTSRWDYDYTGGDPSGVPMDELADRRVGIIGTGATAVQCIPHLARACGELYVFQRTPSSIDIRDNHPIDPDWFSDLEPGWQERWLMNFSILQTGGFQEEDLVHDGWTDITKRIIQKLMSSDAPELTPEGFERAYFESDDEKMDEIRARVDEIVSDPATAEALKPWYRQLCKRPCFHDEYLQAYNEPAAHLVDTDGKGVTRIDETGVFVGDEHYELDCLIFASGFEVGTDYTRRSGYDIVGVDGRRISEYWSNGMRSLHGMHVHGFPNVFVVGFTQAGNLISNIPHNLSEAGTTIAAVVTHAEEIGAEEVEVTAEAEQAWLDRLMGGARQRLTRSMDCTPGYYNNEGQDSGERGLMNGLGFPEGPVAYFRYIDEWRTSGDFEGLEFR